MHGQPKFSARVGVGVWIRLISSQSPHPTSPVQTSDVPGRLVKRNEFRRPYAMTRDEFADGVDELYCGLPVTPAPVSGLMRRSEPLRRRASPVGRRMLWARIAPPRAVGAVWVPPT